MRLTIPSKHLLIAIGRVQNTYTDKKLGFYSFKSEINQDKDSVFKIAATDAYLDIYSEHPCEVETSGECHILCDKFVETIRQLPSGEVELACEDSYLVIRMNETSHFVEIKLPLIRDYIWIPKQELSSTVNCQIPSAQLYYMISQVVFNLINDPLVPYAEMGFLHQPSPNVLRLVATDTIKLSYCDIHCELPDNFLIQGICLSKHALNAIIKVCEQGDALVNFAFCETQKVCRVQIDGYDVYVRPSHVAYPYYTKLIPKEMAPPIILNKEVLIGMIKRAAISVDFSKIVTLNFTHNTMTLTSYDEKSASGLEGKETLMVDYDREPLTFGINSDTMLNILSHVTSSEIGFSIKHQRAALVVYGATEPGDCISRHILAPIAQDIEQRKSEI